MDDFQNIMPQSPELVLEHADEFCWRQRLMLKTDRPDTRHCSLLHNASGDRESEKLPASLKCKILLMASGKSSHRKTCSRATKIRNCALCNYRTICVISVAPVHTSMASRDIMMHTPAASGMRKEDEAILSLDSTPMIGVLMALIAMLVMAMPAEKHLLAYGWPGCYLTPHKVDVSNVDIDFDGSLQWNGKIQTMQEIEQHFKDLASNKDAYHDVYLRASSATTYQQVMTVMASARRHGLTSVGVVNDGFLPS